MTISNATVVLLDTAKYGCDHHGAVNSINISLKKWSQVIPASKLHVKYIIEVASVWDVMPREAQVMVLKLTVHAAAKLSELFAQELVLLQKASVLD